MPLSTQQPPRASRDPISRYDKPGENWYTGAPRHRSQVPLLLDIDENNESKTTKLKMAEVRNQETNEVDSFSEHERGCMKG